MRWCGCVSSACALGHAFHSAHRRTFISSVDCSAFSQRVSEAYFTSVDADALHILVIVSPALFMYLEASERAVIGAKG